ncbi:hypothetical protein ACEQ8H_007745 [Pleosporales sp. CAS-2024a]
MSVANANCSTLALSRVGICLRILGRSTAYAAVQILHDLFQELVKKAIQDSNESDATAAHFAAWNAQYKQTEETCTDLQYMTETASKMALHFNRVYEKRFREAFLNKCEKDIASSDKTLTDRLGEGQLQLRQGAEEVKREANSSLNE